MGASMHHLTGREPGCAPEAAAVGRAPDGVCDSLHSWRATASAVRGGRSGAQHCRPIPANARPTLVAGSDRDLVRAATFVVREFRATEGQVAGAVQMLAQS